MCDASLPHSTIEYPFQHFSTHHFWSSNTTKYSWSIHNTYCYIWSSCPRSWPFVSPSSGNGYWAVKWCPTTTCEDIGKKNSADLGTTPFGSVIESNGCFYLQFCVKEAQNLVETWYMWNKYLILYSYQHNIISKMWICFIKELESNRELQIPDETSRVCVCVCVRAEHFGRGCKSWKTIGEKKVQLSEVDLLRPTFLKV